MRLMLAGVSALTLVGASVMAAPPSDRPMAPRGRDAVRQALGLTDEQAAQMRRLRDDERKEAIRRRADLAIARLELREALGAPTVDEKLVAAKVKTVSDLEAAAVRAKVDRQLALRKILTPEQFQKMHQFLSKQHRGRAAKARLRDGRRARMGQRFRQGPGPRRGAPGAEAARPGL